ncbi:sortase family protein [Streptomyces sp. SD15]
MAPLALAALLTGGGAGTGTGQSAGDTAARGRAPTASASASASASEPSAERSSPDSVAPSGPAATVTPKPDTTSAPATTGDSRVRGPDLSQPAPATSARDSRDSPTKAPATPSAPKTGTGSGAAAGRTETTIRIGTWSARVARGGQDEVDACRDAVQWTGPALGTENGYTMRTAVLVGHDYCGFDRFATLPVGTKVTIATPRGTWAYTVYAGYVTPGRGAPAAGLYWGDLTLQSCVGPDTGFSYLMRD